MNHEMSDIAPAQSLHLKSISNSTLESILVHIFFSNLVDFVQCSLFILQYMIENSRKTKTYLIQNHCS